MAQQQKHVEIQPKPLALPKLMFAGGLAACIAEIITVPVDTIKVRQQLQQGRYRGLLDCARTMVKEEGALALYQGTSAALLRQVFFASIRIGLFDYAIQKTEERKGFGNVTIFDRIGWGMASGAIAICVANPFDVLKVRFQNEVRSGAKRVNVFQAFRHVLATEGMHGFYQSLMPNILRNSVINAVELASYSQAKSYLLSSGTMQEGIPLHFTSSFIAGLLAVVTSSPFDVIKSRVMDGRIINGVKVPYSSILEATRVLAREKGLLGFYAGVNANFIRLVTWNVVMFMTREQILIQLRK